MMGRDETGLLALRNAVRNISAVPVSEAQILAVLRGEGGHASHVRGIFEDVSLSSLAKAGRRHGIALHTILEAYQAARRSICVANPELDALGVE